MMAGVKIHPWAILTLIAGCLLAIGLQWYPAPSIERSLNTGAQQTLFEYQPSPAVRPLERLSDTRTRPVFSPDRSPGRAEVDAGPNATENSLNADDLRLLGTRARSGAFQALVGYPDLESGVWIEEGETVQGWELVTIETAMATFSDGNENVEVWLEGRGRTQADGDNSE